MIVVNDAKEVLILQRSKNTTYPGHWNFPGGKIEPGEEEPVAATRELLEETGLVTVPEVLDYMGDEKKQRVHLKLFITDKYIGDVKINDESQDYKWVSLQDLPNYVFVDNTRVSKDLISEIKEYINWRAK